ncbi:MAG: chromosomal replication initiator protein DnaA [Planctomycetota bacterium]|nr:MAG: chromosomal replication initiator protein DnaA [Planctomycetota bacterium]
MRDQKTNSWSAVLNIIKNKVHDDSFFTWFEFTTLEEFSDGKAIIGVPNKFIKTFIIEKFSSTVQEALSESFGLVEDIQYKIVPELRNKVENARIKGINLKNNKRSTNKANIEETSTNHSNLNPYLGLPLVGNFKLDNYIVGPSNKMAYEGISSVLAQPNMYNPIFLYGGSGLGKTHILHGLCHELLKRNPNDKIIFISCEEFINDFINHIRTKNMNEFRNKYRKINTLIIDDIHFLGQGNKDQTQDEFFHTFDALYNSSCQIIVSSDAHPKDIKSLKDKIQMRFISGLVASIEPPNFATRFKILKQKCKEKGYEFPKEVLEFIASHITNNVRELEGALVKIHASSRFGSKPISINLAEEALNLNSGSFSKQISRKTPKYILLEAAAFFEMSCEDIKLPKRGKNAIPRHLSMLAMRRLYQFSYSEISDEFGLKSHASIVHGEKLALKTIEKDPNSKILYSKLMDHLKNKF